MHRHQPKAARKTATKTQSKSPRSLKKTSKRTMTTKKKVTKKSQITPTTTTTATPFTAQFATISTTNPQASFKSAITSTSRRTQNNNNIQKLIRRNFASMPPSGQLLELPALSPTMEIGGLSKWHVSVGALIKPGDLIADIETDKAVVGFESQDEYYLAAILMEGGAQNLAVGTPLGITVEEEGDIAAAQAYAATLKASAGASAAAPAAEKPKAVEEVKKTAAPAAGTAGKYTHRKLPPSVETMVYLRNIDPSSIKPTGGMGHLTKGDVINAIEAGTVVYLPEGAKKHAPTAAAPTTSATAAAPAAAKTTPAPSQDQSGRRRRPRTFTDVPLTEATQHANKALVNAGIPHNYESGVISLKKINSFINTYAKECDVNAALVSMITKSINTSLNNASKEQDLMVIDKATGQKTLLSRQVATKIGTVFKKANVNAPTDAASSLYNINLYTGLPTNTNNSIERVPVGAVMAVTVGSPFDEVTFVNNALSVERVVKISIATDNSAVHETAAANIIKNVKNYANEPINMLL